MARIDAFFKLMAEQKASDLHLATNNPPMLRINGDLVRVDYPPLQNDELKAMVYEIAPEGEDQESSRKRPTSISATKFPGVARYRANFFQQKYGISAVFRLIPSKVLTVEDLGLPPVLKKFPDAEERADPRHRPDRFRQIDHAGGDDGLREPAAARPHHHGGRSDRIRASEPELPRQHREVGVHTRSFAAALRGALREDPDIMLVGEMRDLETIELALTAAATGHLVFGTLHTSSAAKAVDRMIDVFPADQQNQIRATLSESLKGVVAQNLFKRIDKPGRVAALEILVVDTAIANLVREAKTHQIPGMIQVGKKKGNQPLDDAIMEHLRHARISPEEAYDKCIDKKEVPPLPQDTAGRRVRGVTFPHMRTPDLRPDLIRDAEDV